MLTIHRLVFVLLVAVSLSTGKTAIADAKYNEIEWTQLMPADDLAALLNPPDFLLDIEDGEDNDNIESLSTLSESNETAKRFAQALQSTRVIDAFDQARIRLPGFIVPLQSDEQQRVTHFLLCLILALAYTCLPPLLIKSFTQSFNPVFSLTLCSILIGLREPCK